MNNANLTKEANRGILVVGDWVIDDYWITGKHRSLTASRQGQWHYRALNSPDASVQELAGAGRVASLLHSASLGPVHGLGMWHPDDTAHLKVMFQTGSTRGWTPSRINRTLAEPPKNVWLHSLAPLLGVDQQAGTTRVVRLNRLKGTRIEILGRIDWDARPPERDHELRVWVVDSNAPGIKLPQQNLSDAPNPKIDGALPHPTEIHSIVVKDLVKGVVSTALVRRLAELYPEAEWYVSSKRYAPSYLKLIPKNKLRLYLIPGVAAGEASARGAITHWFCRAGRTNDPKPTLEALQAFRKMFEPSSDGQDGVLETQDATLVVALPEEFRLLAREKTGKGCIQSKLHQLPYTKDASMASAFFPALVADFIRNRVAANGQTPMRFLPMALRFTAAYNRAESEWIASCGQKPLPPTLQTSRSNDSFPEHLLKEWDWESEQSQWDQAMSRPGFITVPKNTVEPPSDNNDRLLLQLWRATTEVDRFVCCVPAKRKAVASLMQCIDRFNHERPDYNMSGILIAKPGSGKTTLVRNLAEAAEMQMLDFNITQMIARQDLLAAFDTIATTQAQNRERPLIVFFDEINARLDSQFVYDMFLAPLQDGVYLRDGKKHAIAPCIWLFAGTERPTQGEAGKDASTKSTDFESRLTMPVVDLTFTHELGSRNENVYRGVAMLRRAYPDVNEVSVPFLEFLFQLHQDITPREVQHILESLQEVQYGQVSMRNVPLSILTQFRRPEFGPTEKYNDEHMVEIE